MSSDQEPHSVNSSTGGHGLGPHVVGQRVVVRRRVPGETGPSGGPAMTDLLGVCEAWETGPAGAIVVRPESGDPVRIALADVVSGKPVPPRASVRDRVSPAEAQRHGFALFPDLVTAPLGGWVLRASATSPARRANSVLAFEPSGVDDDVEQVLAHYRRPVAAVLSGSPEQARLVALGWVPESNESDTIFEVAGVAQLARALRGAASPDVEVREDGGFARARVGDHAGGYAGFDRDWVGLGGIRVDAAHRRRGLGLAVVAALVDWGAERGATTAFLQVLGDNAPALAMYERLGFRAHHRYRYLTPGGPG